MLKNIKLEQLNIWEWLRTNRPLSSKQKALRRNIKINRRNFFNQPTRKVRQTRRTRASSDQQLNAIWQKLAREYFPDNQEIPSYIIVWSKRPQKRTLASCNIEDRKVNVARELNYPELHQWLEPLIYHEMCHAELKYIQKETHRSWHGREFKALEQRHPMMPAFDYWVKSGGWLTAVRSDRGKRAAQKRLEKRFK